MREHYIFWSTNEDNRLREMKGVGFTNREISQFLNRSLSSIRNRAKEIGASVQRDRNQRTNRRKQILKLHKNGLSPREMISILLHMGGTSAQIYRDHHALRLIPHKKAFKRVKMKWVNHKKMTN